MTGLQKSCAAASIIDAGTLQAYRETEYRVLGEQPLTLRVGQVSAGLLALHKSHKVPCSAFLTASYCVLTPFVAWLVAKQRPKLINLVAAIICLTGVGFVALKPGSGSLALSQGDWMTIANAVIFSFNLTFLGRYTQHFHPIAVTFMQFAVADVFFLIGALLTEPLPNASWLAPDVIMSFLYLLIGATTMAQIMQNIGLAHVPPSSAAIIMCTESLFAVAFSAMFWGEAIGWTSIVGFSLIFAAVIMSVVTKRK